ncbi:lysylphosphatidylglycerol synthase transmembrane domain-containing protein [Thermodesulforhabdus norvegica]|uniref:Lysylphosphatidylglycerol synthase TM region n=1 Tax=Thermodesulforhabdus norvegica TaxID=39841 RepID=A0A1I4U6N0_9BACT|nr:lysylphosphatidylglycerol synthase transmembrane domain-containing protein [Thermodesulforhabdus norvegica]SFM84500.1 Lysylphosphatidylglycerol synthase TM region [Thermodesulforhabdus norvegica]
MRHSIKNPIEYARSSINFLFRLLRNKKLTVALKVFITALFLSFLLLRIDGSRLVKIVQKIGFLPWALAFCTYLTGQTVSTKRWQILCQALNYSIPFRTLWKYYLTGCFFNLFLPTSVGGDTVKTIMLGTITENFTESFYTVLWDRLFGIVAMGLILLSGVAVHHQALPSFVDAILVASSLFFLIAYTLFPIIWHMITAFPVAGRINSSFIKFWQPGCLIRALTASLGFHTLWISVHFIFARAAALNIPFTYLMVAVPFASVISTIPVTIHGIGLREGALLYILEFAGIDAEESIVLGILTYSVMLATGAFGGLVYSLLPVETRIMSGSKITSGR